MISVRDRDRRRPGNADPPGHGARDGAAVAAHVRVRQPHLHPRWRGGPITCLKEDAPEIGSAVLEPRKRHVFHLPANVVESIGVPLHAPAATGLDSLARQGRQTGVAKLQRTVDYADRARVRNPKAVRVEEDGTQAAGARGVGALWPIARS